MGSIGTLWVNVTARIAEFRSNMEKVSRTLRIFSGRMKRLGRDMTMSLTLPVVGATALILRQFTKYEDAFVRVRKTVDATDKRLQILSDNLRGLAVNQLPLSADAIADVAAAAGQLGVATEDIEGFTWVMAELGEATDLVAKDAALAFAQFTNITGTARNRVRDLGSALVKLGNTTATFESAIMEMALRLAATGKIVGLTDAQILGLAAAMAQLGIAAQRGGTAMDKTMSQMFKAVLKGGTDLERFGRIAKMSGNEFAAVFRRDASEAIVLFLRGLEQMQENGQNVFAVLEQLQLADIRVRNTLLSLAQESDKAATAIRNASDAFAEGTALGEEFARRMQSTSAQFRLLRNRIEDMAITLGQKLAPRLLEIIDKKLLEKISNFVVRLADALAELNDMTDGWAIKIGIAVVLLGPLLSGVAGLLSIAEKLIPILFANKVGLTAMGLSLAALTPKLIAALPKLIDIVKKLFAVDQATEEVVQSAEAFATVYPLAMNQASNATSSLMGELFSLRGILGGLIAPFGAALDKLKELAIGIEGLEDAMMSWGDEWARVTADAIADGELLALSLRDFIDQIIRDLLRLAIQTEITKPLFTYLSSFIPPGSPASSPGREAPIGGGAHGETFGAGGGVAKIIVNNYSGSPVDVKRKPSASGEQIEITIGAMREAIMGGALDGAAGFAWGVSRVPVGR